MPFILSAQRDLGTIASVFKSYRDYVTSYVEQFPCGAFALASSDWYFDFRDHRCPHDAWLEELTISESATGDRCEDRTTEIRVRLLGAYHDGFIELHYLGVTRYSLSSSSAVRGIGDWLYDEFRLHPDGHLIHEIEWAGFQGDDGSHWLIEAADVKFEWKPNQPVEQNTEE